MTNSLILSVSCYSITQLVPPLLAQSSTLLVGADGLLPFMNSFIDVFMHGCIHRYYPFIYFDRPWPFLSLSLRQAGSESGSQAGRQAVNQAESGSESTNECSKWSKWNNLESDLVHLFYPSIPPSWMAPYLSDWLIHSFIELLSFWRISQCDIVCAFHRHMKLYRPSYRLSKQT